MQANRRVQIDLLWNSGGGVMPIAQFDITERLAEPFVLPDRLDALAEYWTGLCGERERWSE